ncbi:polysaccharide deacetylase family protein [bacterium]|nr:polysaccharide deacetylase family protein [bacterium]
MMVRIPVLMYHEVAEGERLDTLRHRTHADYILASGTFQDQMRYLQANSYHSLNANELVQAVNTGQFASLPPRPVLITFDDGYAGNCEQALPILSQFGMKACFFVTVDEIGAEAMMTWGQLHELVQAGMQVQSHLVHHVMLSELSREEAREELLQSRKVLQERLGVPVELLSLPNGSYHRHYAALAQEAGYCGGFSSKLGYVGANSHPFLLERIPVLRSTTLVRFARILAADGSILAGAKLRQRAHTLLNHLVGESAVNRWYHRFHRIDSPHPER